MKVIAMAVGLVAAMTSVALAKDDATKHGGAAAGEHAMENRAELKWGPAPDAFPPGAQMTVIQGDPGAQGEMFTVRLKMPKGYTIPPHTHPTAEYVTVVSGALQMGDGDRIDKKSAKTLKVGGWAAMPAGHQHYAIAASGDTEVQVHAMGPFAITYVNPSDDPRNKKQASR